MEQAFNIRVYGIVTRGAKVLISHEQFRNLSFTKFPGGGLTWGEGIIACLNREFQEELGWAPEQWSHYYTTENFQVSAFNDRHQLISIYYKAELATESQHESMPGSHLDQAINRFEWVDIERLHPKMFRWPIDQLVVAKILSDHPSSK